MNPYGSLVGYLTAVFFRFAAGESTLSIGVLIHYPNYDDVWGQLFPFRTFSMLMGLVGILGVSYLVNCLFKKGIIPERLVIETYSTLNSFA